MRKWTMTSAALLLLAGGCQDTDLEPDPQKSSEQQRVDKVAAAAGKADAFAGSCPAEHCGKDTPTETGCYCDDLCERIGDCCPDKRTVCDGCDYTDPDRDYAAKSPSACALIDIDACSPGWQVFSDKCGCGCERLPGTSEDCENAIDDDLDGKVDCADDDCATHPSCRTAQCTTTCDCPQGLFCAPEGTCALGAPAYCCTKQTCPDGSPCVNPDGSSGTCGEEPSCDYSETKRDYAGKSPSECALIDIDACSIGWEIFSDACGCGCECEANSDDHVPTDRWFKSTDPAVCLPMYDTIECPRGWEIFSDACGCGCEKTPCVKAGGQCVDGAVACVAPVLPGNPEMPCGGVLARTCCQASAVSCQNNCDCSQGMLCDAGSGQCLPGTAMQFCCNKPGCPSGTTCTNPDGSQGTCL